MCAALCVCVCLSVCLSVCRILSALAMGWVFWQRTLNPKKRLMVGAGVAGVHFLFTTYLRVFYMTLHAPTPHPLALEEPAVGRGPLATADVVD